MSGYEDPDQTTLSIPSLVAFAIISFFTIRYFFFSPRNSSSSSSTQGQSYPGGTAASRRTGAGDGGGGAGRRNATREKIEMVATMFPQLNRRDIEWDLERNGGSVQATTERVLREGRLPVPPPNFVAQEAPATTASTTGSRTSTPQQSNNSNSNSKSPQHKDLITRYNLSGRVNSSQSTSDDSEGSASVSETIQSKAKQLSRGSWSSNKIERAELLKRRREEMILAARRKMEDKDRKGKEKEPAAASSST